MYNQLLQSYVATSADLLVNVDAIDNIVGISVAPVLSWYDGRPGPVYDRQFANDSGTVWTATVGLGPEFITTYNDSTPSTSTLQANVVDNVGNRASASVDVTQGPVFIETALDGLPAQRFTRITVDFSSPNSDFAPPNNFIKDGGFTIDGVMPVSEQWEADYHYENFGGVGQAIATGVVLTYGNHTITAGIANFAEGGNDGGATTISHDFTLLPETEPSIQIIEPSNGEATNTPLSIQITFGPTNTSFAVDTSTLSVVLDGQTELNIEHYFSVTSNGALAAAFPTTLVPPGNHSLIASVTDTGGVVGTSCVISFTLAGPTIAFKPVPPSLIQMGSLVVTADFSGTDDGMITGPAQLQIDDSSPIGPDMGSATTTGSSWTLALTEGEHVLTASISDSMGATSTATAYVSVDTSTPPSISLIPSNGSATNQSPLQMIAEFSGIAPIDTSTVQLLLDDVSVGPHVTANEAIAYTHSPMTVGAHTLTASMSDTTGENTTMTSIFIYDNLGPSLTITSPIGGVGVDLADGTVLLAGTVVTVAGAGVTVNGMLVGTSPTSQPNVISFSEMENLVGNGGATQFAIVATDFAGNPAADATVIINSNGDTSIVQDLVPPVLSQVSAQPGAILPTSFVVSGNVSHPVGVQSVLVNGITSNLVQTVSTGPGWTGHWAIVFDNVTPGPLNLSIVAIDTTGDVTSPMTIGVTVSASEAQVPLLTVANPHGVTGSTVVQVSGATPELLALQLPVLANRYPVDWPASAGSQQFTGTAYLVPNTSAVTFLCTDIAGTDCSVSVDADLQPPDVQVNSLPNNGLVMAGQAIELTGTLSDLTNVAEDHVFVNGSVASFSSTVPTGQPPTLDWTIFYTPTCGAPLAVYAVDVDGNQSEPQYVAFTLQGCDNSPILTIINPSPYDPFPVGTSITVQGSITDITLVSFLEVVGAVPLPGGGAINYTGDTFTATVVATTGLASIVVMCGETSGLDCSQAVPITVTTAPDLSSMPIGDGSWCNGGIACGLAIDATSPQVCCAQDPYCENEFANSQGICNECAITDVANCGGTNAGEGQFFASSDYGCMINVPPQDAFLTALNPETDLLPVPQARFTTLMCNYIGAGVAQPLTSCPVPNSIPVGLSSAIGFGGVNGTWPSDVDTSVYIPGGPNWYANYSILNTQCYPTAFDCGPCGILNTSPFEYCSPGQPSAPACTNDNSLVGGPNGMTDPNIVFTTNDEKVAYEACHVPGCDGQNFNCSFLRLPADSQCTIAPHGNMQAQTGICDSNAICQIPSPPQVIIEDSLTNSAQPALFLPLGNAYDDYSMWPMFMLRLNPTTTTTGEQTFVVRISSQNPKDEQGLEYDYIVDTVGPNSPAGPFQAVRGTANDNISGFPLILPCRDTDPCPTDRPSRPYRTLVVPPGALVYVRIDTTSDQNVDDWDHSIEWSQPDNEWLSQNIAPMSVTMITSRGSTSVFQFPSENSGEDMTPTFTLPDNVDVVCVPTPDPNSPETILQPYQGANYNFTTDSFDAQGISGLTVNWSIVSDGSALGSPPVTRTDFQDGNPNWPGIQISPPSDTSETVELEMTVIDSQDDTTYNMYLSLPIGTYSPRNIFARIGTAADGTPMETVGHVNDDVAYLNEVFRQSCLFFSLPALIQGHVNPSPFPLPDALQPGQCPATSVISDTIGQQFKMMDSDMESTLAGGCVDLEVVQSGQSTCYFVVYYLPNHPAAPVCDGLFGETFTGDDYISIFLGTGVPGSFAPEDQSGHVLSHEFGHAVIPVPLVTPDPTTSATMLTNPPYFGDSPLQSLPTPLESSDAHSIDLASLMNSPDRYSKDPPSGPSTTTECDWSLQEATNATTIVHSGP